MVHYFALCVPIIRPLFLFEMDICYFCGGFNKERYES